MKTIKITLFITVVTQLIGQSVFGQTSKLDSGYLNIVKAFYNDLFEKNAPILKECYRIFDKEGVLENEEFLFESECSKNNVDNILCAENFKKHLNANDQPSLFFAKLREQSENLTLGSTQMEVYKAINASLVTSYYGHPNSKFVTLILNKRHVYFLIGNYDDGLHLIIDNIYFGDGQSIYNNLYPQNKNYLKITGNIIDKDGFTNVRTQANINSTIVNKIQSGEEIWYTPNDNCLWWMIESKTNSNLRGFVYFNRIVQNNSK